MGLMSAIFKRLVYFTIFFVLIVFLPGLPPKTIFPVQKFNITLSRELKGPYEINNHLDNAERLLDGKVYGPECLLARENEIFTTIHGGEVIKITSDHVTHVAKFGKPCEAVYEEAKCGRPLGIAFDTLGDNLIVADAYYGIWQVDLSNGRKTHLILPNEVLDGKVRRPAKIFNDVAVDKKGDIYWTDSSSDFTLEDGFFTLLTNPSGRLFHYNRATKENSLLMDEINFANGVVISPNEDFLLVSETGSSRILRYYLVGSKKGQHDVFIDGLPGIPDNLTPDPEGIWIPLAAARDENTPLISQSLAKLPLVRKFILRLFALLEAPFRFVHNSIPNSYTQKVLHFIGHFESVKLLITPKRTTIVRADWSGNIVGSLHGFDNSVSSISHVLKFGDYLYLGSPFNKYIGRVELPRGPQIKIRNVKMDGMEPLVKPITDTPKFKATTTTSRPNTIAKPQVPTTTEKPRTTTTQSTTRTTERTTTIPKAHTTKATESIPTVTTTVKPSAQTLKSTPTTSTTTPKPKMKATTKLPPKREVPEEPAPIKENRVKDIPTPAQPKLKVIKRGGEHGEL